jgi:hypothetical protein
MNKTHVKELTILAKRNLAVRTYAENKKYRDSLVILFYYLRTDKSMVTATTRHLYVVSIHGTICLQKLLLNMISRCFVVTKGTLTRDILAFFIIFNIKSVFF